MISQYNTFENRELLAQALADRVARGLSRAISRQGHAVLAVSGGTTPALFFDHLSLEEIDWEKVTVTLVDERQVEDTSPRSNAKLVKDNLLKHNAASARFVPLYQNVEAAEKLILDVVVLGMGEDGHTASFFPQGDKLAAALDVKSQTVISTMEAPAASEPRLTFTLAHLMKAKVVCLQLEGQKKQTIFETARAGSDIYDMPIRAVLQSDTPLEIFWCP